MIRKDKPILFSTEMVRAILREESPKTVTRRVIKPQPKCASSIYYPCQSDDFAWDWEADDLYCGECGYPLNLKRPYAVGDRLWVREAWQYIEGASGRGYAYKAGGSAHNDTGKWRPSIHMPRAASRITLEVVSVTAERLRDITEEDAIAEGIVPELPPCLESTQRFPDGFENWSESEKEQFYTSCATGNYIAHVKVAESLTARYANLWDSLNAARGFGWDANPWVFRNEFRNISV